MTKLTCSAGGCQPAIGPVPRLTLPSAAAAMLLMLVSTAAAAGPRMTMESLIHGKKVEGTPLAWSNQMVFLLGRDGGMVEFRPGEAKDYRKIADNFVPYPQSILRGKLEREFGPQFEVSSTAHFLVVHPRGQKQQWVDRFEEMYRSFWMYFTVRGFKLTNPEFPLVAIVFGNESDFRRYATADKAPSNRGLLGYYSPQSNRVLLYDLGDGRASDAAWQQNFATVLHEASHQTAFNTGIHSRWSPPPRWVAEGLGTMFEARGVADSRNYPHQPDRINRGRLDDFRALRAKRQPAAFVELLGSDRQFDRDPIAAYAEAWAFTFFLVEKMPRQYAAYLAKTANREPFTLYPAAQRVKDFTDVFGQNMPLLDAQFLRFIDELK